MPVNKNVVPNAVNTVDVGMQDVVTGDTTTNGYGDDEDDDDGDEDDDDN